MKNRNIIVFLLLLIMFCGCRSGKKDGPVFKRYGVKAGIIEFEIKGDTSANETMYFDHWGMREAKYTQGENSLNGVKEKINTLTVLEGKWFYFVDLDRKAGIRRQNEQLVEWMNESQDGNLLKTLEGVLKKSGGVLTGRQETVAGKVCDIWEINNGNETAWVWNGIMLRYTIKDNKSISMNALSVKDNVNVPRDKFVVPSYIDVMDGEDLNKMAKEIQGKLPFPNASSQSGVE
jgi:hypothetical protein